MVKKKSKKKDTAVGIDDFDQEQQTAIDGKWGWFIVFNSFVCNMIVDGMQYTFANLLLPIQGTFNQSATVVALIGSLLSGFYNFAGPLGSALGNKFGLRMVCITGSITSSFGLSISYFAMDVHYLYFFYGVLGGLGFGMIYMASVITTSIYFEKYRALAASLSVCGTGVGTFVFAPLGNFLVDFYGWRLALVVEGGLVALSLFWGGVGLVKMKRRIAKCIHVANTRHGSRKSLSCFLLSAFLLICIFCALSYKPINIIDVVPLSEEAPEVREEGEKLSRGSIYYQPAATRRLTLPNIAYPTIREAMGQEEGRRLTNTSTRIFGGESSSTLHDSRMQRIFSVVPSAEFQIRPRILMKKTFHDKVEKCCTDFCFNFWHCRLHHRNLNLGDRPLYRDDIFYEGKLANISDLDKLDYRMSVTRLPAPQDIEEHTSRKCCVCPHAFIRTCITMMGFHLFKSKIFVFLCAASFTYTMALYIPYVFITRLTIQCGIEESEGVWLISTIGLANTAGRLASGVLKSFININASIIALICLMGCGLFSFIFVLPLTMTTFFCFALAFGFLSAPFISLRPVIIVEFLGLEKLTNAFGLVLLSQGIASIIGPPIAGIIEEKTKNDIYVFYFAGGLMLLSGFCLMISVFLHYKKQKN